MQWTKLLHLNRVSVPEMAYGSHKAIADFLGANQSAFSKQQLPPFVRSVRALFLAA
jgi:hypothetical protein